METAEKQRGDNHLLLALAICVGGFLSLYNSVAMNIAIPSFMTVFQTDLKNIQWIMIAYTLAMGVFSPLTGYFADRISSRNLFAFAMVGFAIAALAAGFCQNIYQMIFFRVIQGLLAAVIVPCSMMIIYQFIPRKKQPTYLSLQSMALSMGPAVGPVVAGYLLNYVSWQWLFWINTPLALFTAYAIYRSVPYVTRHVGDKLDYFSLVYVIMGTVLILVGFNQGEDWGLTSPRFLIMEAVGVVLVALFVKRELNSTFPILNFSVLKYPAYTICLIINSFISMALCLVPFVLAIYFQNILYITPLESGILLLIPAIFSIGGAPVAQFLYKRMDSKILIIGSIFMIALGSITLGRLTLQTSMVYVIAWLCFRYLGIGLSSMPITDYGMKFIPPETAGHGSSLLNWCKMMATSLSLSIFTMVLGMRTSYYQQTMPGALGQLMGINDVFIYSGLLLFAATLLAFFLKKGSRGE